RGRLLAALREAGRRLPRLRRPLRLQAEEGFKAEEGPRPRRRRLRALGRLRPPLRPRGVGHVRRGSAGGMRRPTLPSRIISDILPSHRREGGGPVDSVDYGVGGADAAWAPPSPKSPKSTGPPKRGRSAARRYWPWTSSSARPFSMR